MAIDFNKQLVFDPKIEIVGNEVPLAAMEKTGAVLQDRYDKSYENYSLADEALKQMEASANVVDREKAKELREMYNQEMQGILQKGDFHNMRQQTAALARNAAVNYKTIAEKNAKIQAELDAIAKNPKYALDPEGAAQDYLKNLKSISINPETKTISDFNVGTYNAAADVDEMKWAITYGAVMKPTIDKVKGTTTVGVDKFGKETSDPNQVAMLMIKTKSGQLVELKPEDLQKTLLPAAYADPNIQARLDRDTKRAGYDPDTEEGKLYKQGLFNNQTLPAISAAAGLLRRKEDMGAETVAFHNLAKGDSDGGGGLNDPLAGLIVPNEETSGVGLDGVPSGYDPQAPQTMMTRGILGLGKGALVLRDKVTKNEVANNFSALMDAMDYNIEKAPDDATANRFKEAKQFFKDYKKLVKDYPEWGATVAEIHQSRGTNIIPFRTLINIPGMVAENVASLFSDKAKYEKFENERFKIEQKYGKIFNTDVVDSEVEQGIQDYLKTDRKPVATSTKMIAAGLTNPKLQAAFNEMGKIFNQDNVEIYKASKGFNVEQPFEFRKVASEPRGDGIGILFEVWQKDKDGKTQTALVEPNYDGVGSALPSIRQAIYETTKKDVNLPFANAFKNVRRFSRVGEIRTIGEVFKEAGMDVLPNFANLQLKKVEKGYEIEGLKGVEVINGKPRLSKKNKVFPSYIEAIYELQK
jgi:hypothetical protein